jgi:membrane protein
MVKAERSRARAFFNKVRLDNITMLASVVAWGVLSSVIPIVAGLIAISGVVLRDHVRERIVIDHLSQALQNVLSPSDLSALVQLVVQHTGLFGVLGVAGVVWGGSNVGGSISTAFQPIFQVRGRSIIHEKLIDIGMIFVFTFLMLVIITGTTAGAILDRLVDNAPFGATSSFVIGTVISLLASFLLFFVIYAVFPNIDPRFKVGHVWQGTLIAALLFQGMSYIWPLYAHFFRPQRYGAVLAPIVVLGVWIYFFSLILVLGAEVIAFGALKEARAAGKPIGPSPDGTVPQRTGIREDFE